MPSKKLGALLRSVPPATAGAADEPEIASPHVERPASQPASLPAQPQSTVVLPAEASLVGATGQGRGAVPEREVPLQVLIPVKVRRQLAFHCAEQGESLRSVMLQAIRSLGIEVSAADIAGKRGRKNY